MIFIKSIKLLASFKQMNYIATPDCVLIEELLEAGIAHPCIRFYGEAVNIVRNWVNRKTQKKGRFLKTRLFILIKKKNPTIFCRSVARLGSFYLHRVRRFNEKKKVFNFGKIVNWSQPRCVRVSIEYNEINLN